MFRTAIFVLAAAFAAAPSARADDKMTAEIVLKKAIDAAGGEEALKKYPARLRKVEGTLERGDKQVAVKAEIAYAAPDKLKSTINARVDGMRIKVVCVVNGEAARVTVNGIDKRLEDEDREEAKESLVEMKVVFLFPLLDAKAFEVKLLPEMGKVDGADAYVLGVKPKDGKEFKVFFDSKTFLVSKTERVGKDPETKKEGREEEFPSDYRKVQGVLFAMKSKTLFDGKPKEEIRVTEVKLLDKIPASEFDISD